MEDGVRPTQRVFTPALAPARCSDDALLQIDCKDLPIVLVQ